MDLETMHCVNPHEINPICGVSNEPTSKDTPLIAGRIKLEMEEFSDLAPYLPDTTPRVTLNSMDELNTPVFDEKGPFDFMVHGNTQQQQLATTATISEPFKFECNNHVNDDRAQSPQDLLTAAFVYQNEGSEANNNNNLMFALSPSPPIIVDNQEIVYHIAAGNKETPITEAVQNSSATLFKLEAETSSVLSANHNNNYSNVSSPNDFYDSYYGGAITPEDSNSCEKKPSPKLKLSLANEPSFVFNTIINTPDVIQEVVELENNFNILDYVDSQDITTVNLSDIYVENPTTSQRPQRKRKAKRYDDEDDDDDYIPDDKEAKHDYSDSESDSGLSAKRPSTASSTKRLRATSRRTSSISSDHSDASKYRELRDKNNEASRKSRLKRKMKEVTLEKEADQLESRNIKLKAKVDELERVVNNFRSNLFKIMLKK